MPSGRKGNKLASKSKPTQESTNLKTGQEFRDSSVTASTPHHGTGSGLPSMPSLGFARSFQMNPASVLHEPPKARETAQAQKQPKSPTRGQAESIIKSIEVLLRDEHHYSPPSEDSEEETSTSLSDTDPEQTFNRSWGCLPPLGGEASAVIDAIIANPAMAEQLRRIGPDSAMFPQGLEDRNVFLDESFNCDPYMDHIKHQTPTQSVLERKEDRESHAELWTKDQAKCSEGSNEALFQRTMMMNLISRHCFIYGKDDTDQRCLDFSVEETWTCPPMPTRAYENKEKFLTQPKPDLAVCFRRQALIPDRLWFQMPMATKRLACFENMGLTGRKRSFHFLTIEAKKQGSSALDTVGLCQSLNNASQALHNMFEFFHEAGPQHEDIFFAKVRFFSVVASTEGLTIRIHRAARSSADGSGPGFIVEASSGKPGYSLTFEYRVFAEILRNHNFDRETVFGAFERILIGYGESELRLMICNAAEAIMAKLRNDPGSMRERANPDFYRYGQTKPQTPAGSDDVSRIGTATPTQSRSPTPRRVSQLGGSGGKRPRGQSDDSLAERYKRTKTS